MHAPSLSPPSPEHRANDLTDFLAAEHHREALVRAERMRALGQLASGVAHDLNQSLALVAGYTDLVRQMLDRCSHDHSTLVETLGVIAQAAADGGETVKRLLTFSRAPTESPAESVDVGALLWDVARLTAPHWRDTAQAEGRAVRVQVNATTGLYALGWASSLREALTNLVFNAVDALPSGGTIRLSAYLQDGRILVAIADSGIGIPRETQSLIFEPFFTTKGERGTGLGLSMVFGIVEHHQGTIQVQSEPGQGTTFYLSLPAVADEAFNPSPSPSPSSAASQAGSPSDANTAANSAPSPVAASGPSSRPPRRILVVDDEPALVRMAALLLEREGHATATAQSGEEAIRLIEAEPTFDVVVTDLGMGAGMSGWDLAEAVRERWPSVRVVLATGWGAQIDPQEARSRGVHTVVAKPYSGQNLKQAVSAAS